MVPPGLRAFGGWGSEGLVGGRASPGDTEGHKHQNEETEEDQADDERQQDRWLVGGTGEAWPKDACRGQLSSLDPEGEQV